MQHRPTKGELLGMVEHFLREELLPLAEGRTRFHLLVAMNLLGIVERELELEQAHRSAERQGLEALLGEGEAPAGGEPRDPAEPVRRANERLCDEIREGGFASPEEQGRLFAHLRATLANDLAVANPRFLARVREED